MDHNDLFLVVHCKNQAGSGPASSTASDSGVEAVHQVTQQAGQSSLQIIVHVHHTHLRHWSAQHIAIHDVDTIMITTY
jgi:hypothetical protein